MKQSSEEQYCMCYIGQQGRSRESQGAVAISGEGEIAYVQIRTEKYCGRELK